MIETRTSKLVSILIKFGFAKDDVQAKKIGLSISVVFIILSFLVIAVTIFNGVTNKREYFPITEEIG